MSNAIVPVSEYQITQYAPNEFQAIIRENMGDQGINPFQLDTVRVPSGGGTRWTIPSITGEVDAEDITGVIVYWEDGKSLWRESLESSGGGTPPDCRGLFIDMGQGFKVWQGFGDPGVPCDECEFNKFGPNGERKKCKDMLRMYLLRPTDMLPIVVVAPATSIRHIRTYFRRLVSAGTPYWAAVTKLSLNRVKSKTNINYSEIAPTFVAGVPDEQRGAMVAYKELLAESILEAHKRQIRRSADGAQAVDDGAGLEAPAAGPWNEDEEGAEDAFADE